MQQTLAKLLTLPEPDFDWQPGKDTALLKLGFTLDDAPDLIAIANLEHIRADLEIDSTEANWDAAIHAYRALAELRHPDHLDVFLGLLKRPETADNDLFNEDITAIIPLYGEDAVEPCLAAMEDQRLNENDQITYTDILEKLATAGHLEELIIQRFTAYLNQKHFTRSLNAWIIASLTELKATSAIDAIRDCYHAHLADITINGDLEEVEISLGLRDVRSSESVLNLQELEQKSEHEAIKADLGPRPKGEVDLFIYLFELYSRDCSVDGLSGLHATLTGAILAPGFVKPSEYLSFIWDTDNTEDPYSPVWENRKDAEFFMKFIMGMHNQIVESLDQGDFEPIPDEREDNPDFRSYVVWLLSFNRSFGRWSPATSPDELNEDQLQIITHTSDILQKEAQAVDQGALPDTSGDIEQISSLFCRIYAENKNSRGQFLSKLGSASPFSPIGHTETHTRDQAKISRNAPCPCGSGKKFKRCCMN